LNILGLIPARGGSKGIPGKNIKMLGGKPLLAYTVDAATKSSSLNRVILSSDDAEIISVANEIGLEVPFVRPADLASDSAPTLPTILHALDFFEKQGLFFDAVCLLQTTSPFRAPGMIDAAIQKFIEQDADALVSVRAVPHEFNPHWVFEPTQNDFLKIATGDKEIISRRQNLPPAFIRDGALYITKSSVLKEQNSLYGQKLAYFETNDLFHVNLDTLQDWEDAESKVGSYLKACY
jgi:N-acylneuraminate cytidylyltransferase